MQPLCFCNDQTEPSLFFWWTWKWATPSDPEHIQGSLWFVCHFAHSKMSKMTVQICILVSLALLKVFSSSLDALSKSVRVTLHGMPPLCCWNLGNFMVHSVLKQLHISVSFSSDLEVGEQPVIRRVEIWTVPWMWHNCDVPGSQEISDRSGVMRWCIVMKEAPSASMENLWSIPPDCSEHPLNHTQVESASHTQSIGYEFTVHKSKLVKKHNQHDLRGVLLYPHNCWFGCSGG